MEIGSPGSLNHIPYFFVYSLLIIMFHFRHLLFESYINSIVKLLFVFYLFIVSPFHVQGFFAQKILRFEPFHSVFCSRSLFWGCKVVKSRSRNISCFLCPRIFPRRSPGLIDITHNCLYLHVFKSYYQRNTY